MEILIFKEQVDINVKTLHETIHANKTGTRQQMLCVSSALSSTFVINRTYRCLKDPLRYIQ